MKLSILTHRILIAGVAKVHKLLKLSILETLAPNSPEQLKIATCSHKTANNLLIPQTHFVYSYSTRTN
jgi:hypothetical protein